MKKTFLLLIFALLSTLSLRADGNDNNTSKVDLRLLRKGPSDPLPGRQRIPANQFLLFYYNSNTHECEFTLREEIEYVSICITECDTGITYSGEVTQDDPVMIQDLNPGYYRITCITDQEDIYEGEGPIE